ncbi:hypothetical protein FR969_21345 [Enterobacter roggenkampii]|nr:hypothetical protein FR969_21345 [Enterobacter roggenkampii]
MTMNLNQIREKYQYTDEDGVTRDRTLNIPHYFKEITSIYSPHLEGGKVKFSAEMQKLYCYVADWEKSGGVCYEEQSELAKVCGLKPRQTINLINTLELIGLITRTKIPGRRNKELRALPLTDAHITPPETQQEAPEEAPAPTMTRVIEEAVIIPESVTASTERVQAVDDVAIIETVCELLSKPDSLRQQSRGDTFINYARRVLKFNNKRLPSRLEEKLEECFESRFPHFYSRFGVPF